MAPPARIRTKSFHLAVLQPLLSFVSLTQRDPSASWVPTNLFHGHCKKMNDVQASALRCSCIEIELGTERLS